MRRATFKKELSYVDQIKSFDDNISVTSSLSYLQDLLYMGIVAIAYQEPVTVKVNRSFVLLPETPEMMPRMADPRRSEERRVGKEGRSRWSPYH